MPLEHCYDDIAKRTGPISTARETTLEQTGTFSASRYSISDLQLFRDSKHEVLAPLLAACPIVRVGAGKPVEDTTRARLYIVLSGALTVG